MEIACDGCQKNSKAKDKLSSSTGKHTCSCRSREEKIKIDAGIDQTAAAASERQESSTGKSLAEGD